VEGQLNMISPLRDKILVKPKERVKSSLIVVLQSEEDNMGTIVKVGPGKLISSTEREEMPVKVGQFIRFGTMNRDAKEEYLKFLTHYEDGVKYLLMSWKDVCFITTEI